MSEQSGNAIPAELERLLLDEPTQSEQLASMKATLDHLVILSSRNIHDRAETLRNTPSLLENQVEGGTRAQSKTGEELANLARACIDSECEKIDEELQKLRHVEAQLNAIVILVAQKLPAMVNMVLAQTENSEKRMQELAQFLQVDFTMVLDKVKTMSTHAPQQISRLIQASSRDLPGPSKSKSGDGANTYAQLNVDEFQDVEYHLEFDPIAAAQGEYRRLRPLSPVRSEQSSRKEQLGAAAESGVEPIAIDPEPVARWV
ncbi:hypothetical protein ANCDUO_00325 [Ancylostoma duodenale]|uniref:Uncharacterized protein n=1 Tax=Ancylostoma duodenale TaxID=51022 RepID=A0A0C2HCF8_9BILA|nr:hypothetical protein ANCDUO_00325 [Ancylostoma duodenale]